MLSIHDMLKAGVHFGHATRFWCPRMEPYIFGSRDKIHIIDLRQTQKLYEDAVNYVSKIVASGGKVLFVGTKRVARDIVKEEAARCGMPYVDHRWLGGMLTNYKTVRLSIRRLRELEKMRDDNVFERMIKKEALQMSRQLGKLDRSLGGIKHMNGLPEAIFVIDVKYEKIAIKEANRLKIPVLGIVDTNSDPEGISHIIPGNDDSMAAVHLYLNGLADAILAAKPAAGSEALAEEAAMKKATEKTTKKAIASDVPADAKAAVEELDQSTSESVTKPDAEAAAEPEVVTPSVVVADSESDTATGVDET